MAVATEVKIDTESAKRIEPRWTKEYINSVKAERTGLKSLSDLDYVLVWHGVPSKDALSAIENEGFRIMSGRAHGGKEQAIYVSIDSNVGTYSHSGGIVKARVKAKYLEPDKDFNEFNQFIVRDPTKIEVLEIGEYKGMNLYPTYRPAKKSSLKPTPEAKEPWKMTRDEYGRYAKEEAEDYYKRNPPRSEKTATSEIELARTNALNSHHGLVRQALEKGKPVPAEVLKDYPELGKKEEPSSQFQVTHRDASGVADVLKAKNGEIIGRIGRGEKKGWWEAVVGGTWFTAKTPERVLELATKRRNEEPFKGKEGWQIPRGDWMKAESAGKKVPWPSGVAGEPTGGVGRMMDPHYAMVERAVEAGKPVPANVLKSYPELMKQAKPEPKAEGKGKEVTPQGKVRYHIEPDGVIKAREIGGTGRTLASWRPGNRPDSTTKNDAGSIWHDDKVYINKADWDKAVRQKLDLDTSHFVADSWRGGGMIHKGNLIKEQEKPSASVKPKSAKSHPKYEGTKRLEPKPRKEIAALKPKPATKQSDRAIAIDRALLAKQVVSVDDPRWLRQPNRFDVRGIDTPGSGRVVSRTGFADKGKTRMSRKHHRGWKRIKL